MASLAITSVPLTALSSMLMQTRFDILRTAHGTELCCETLEASACHDRSAVVLLVGCLFLCDLFLFHLEVRSLILDVWLLWPRRYKNCCTRGALGRNIPFILAKNISFTFWSFKYKLKQCDQVHVLQIFPHCPFYSCVREVGFSMEANQGSQKRAVSHRVGNLIDIWPDED